MNLAFLAAAMALTAYSPNTTVSVEFAAIILDDGVSTAAWRGNTESGDAPVDYTTLYYVTNDQVNAISIPFSALSQYHHYNGPEIANFYRSPPNMEQPVDTWPAPTATVKLEPHSGRAYLIFITESFAAMRFRILPITAAPEGGNALRIFNFSGMLITARLGDQQDSIQSGSSLLLPFDTGIRYERLRIAAYPVTTEQWQVIYSRLLQIRDGLSITALIFPDLKGRDRAIVRLIREEGTMRRKQQDNSNTSQ